MKKIFKNDISNDGSCFLFLSFSTNKAMPKGLRYFCKLPNFLRWLSPYGTWIDYPAYGTYGILQLQGISGLI